jgi:hypothetical protein
MMSRWEAAMQTDTQFLEGQMRSQAYILSRHVKGDLNARIHFQLDRKNKRSARVTSFCSTPNSGEWLVANERQLYLLNQSYEAKLITPSHQRYKATFFGLKESSLLFSSRLRAAFLLLIGPNHLHADSSSTPVLQENGLVETVRGLMQGSTSLLGSPP